MIRANISCPPSGHSIAHAWIALFGFATLDVIISLNALGIIGIF